MHSDALSAAIARQSMLRVRLTDAATERHAFALVDPTGSLEELKSAAIDKLKMQVGSDVNLSVTDAELTSIDELRDGDHVLCKRSNRGVSFKGRATIERTLELRTFEVHSVYDLDAEKQTCQLVFYVVFAFANGAGDPCVSWSRSSDLCLAPSFALPSLLTPSGSKPRSAEISPSRSTSRASRWATTASPPSARTPRGS